MTQFDQAFRDLELNPTPESLGSFTTQVETLSKMLSFADMKTGIMDSLRKIRRDQKFDAVRNHEAMLRLYKLLGAYSENLGLKGIYEQLHQRGHFNTSLKFYLQWAEELAKKSNLAEFGNVLQMARDALSSKMTMTEIESGFRDLADEYFCDGRAAALFASPDDTLDVFRDVGIGRKMKRRSSVCHLQQVAPVNNAKDAVFGPKTKTKLRAEFIDVPGTYGISIEEFRYANWKDTFGEDVDTHRRDSGIVHIRHQPTDRSARADVENRIAANLNPRRRPLSPLSEGGADEDEEKRSRIYSPVVPTKDATRAPLRNSTSANIPAPPTITLSSDTKSSSLKDHSYLDDSAENEKLKAMAAGRHSSEKNTTRSSSVSTSSIRTAKSGGGLDLQAENECLEAHAMFSDTVHLGTTEKTLVVSDEPSNRTMTLATATAADDFSVLCDPDPTMNMTHDRPKKTSGGLNVVFDEDVPVEEPKIVEQVIKKQEQSRLSALELKTPPSIGDGDDMFDDELLYGHGFGGGRARGAMVTSTPAAGVPFVDIEAYFGNKSEEKEEEEMVKPTFVVPSGSTFNKLARRKSQVASAALAASQVPVAPPTVAPTPKPFAPANSSIDCLSENLGRRLSIGADEIKSISEDAETTGIANRRRSEIIKQGDINPWDETLRRRLMATVRAPLNMHEFPERAPKIQAYKNCEVGGEVYHIQTLIGQGGYAKVYRAVTEDKKTVAVKYEVPSCSWEVYICDQMRNRLIKDRGDRVDMADWCIMKVMDAYVFSTASLLVNEYHEYGTLLEYANAMKDPNWHISCFLLTQMARILKEVHACKVIHGDIKPDNFMITRKIDANWDKDALLSNDTFVIKVIDWGRAIDMMQLKDQTFKGRAGTEGFDSPEMIDGRSWNYQADYFGFAATMAVVVTGKYAKLAGDQVGDYSLNCDIKRRNVLRQTIVGTINKFLNIESSNSLPDWTETIQEFAADWEEHYDATSWRQAIAKFNEVCDLAVASHK